MNTSEVEIILASARAGGRAEPYEVAQICEGLIFCRDRARDLVERLREVEPDLHALRKNVEVLATDLATIEYEVSVKGTVTMSAKDFSRWRARLEKLAESI